MNQGNWKCSGCGGVISELPFIPRSEDGLKCRDCFSKGRGSSASAPTTDGAPATRPTFSGDWSCSGCGAAITSLPFEPRNTANLKCIDCFKSSRA